MDTANGEYEWCDRDTPDQESAENFEAPNFEGQNFNSVSKSVSETITDELEAISDQHIANAIIPEATHMIDAQEKRSNGRKLPPFILKNLPENEVANEYKKWLGTLNSRDALDELWSRHGQLLRKLAINMARSYGHIASEDDFLQEAYLGAMNGYKLFDAGKGAKLTTWTFHKAQRHILDEIDKQGSVHVPTQQRKMRSFLSGKYDADPIRRASVMSELKLYDDDDVAKARTNFQLLHCKMTSLDADHSESEDGTLSLCDSIPDPNTLSQNQLVNDAHARSMIESLSDFDQCVYDCLYAQQLTVYETRDYLGVTEGKVRSSKRHLLSIMSKAKIAEQAETLFA